MRIVINITLFFITLLSFWVFSRFTVDDAFITWRYGKNLVESGVWNYNPNTADLTLAYTNPVYALLSIIPHWLGINVVLFFKVLSLAILGLSLYVFRGTYQFSWLYIFCLLAIPSTFIQLFAGLSTYLFGFLLGCLFISFYLEKLKIAVLLTALLVITRPEGWLLVALTPGYFYLNEVLKMNSLALPPKRFVFAGMILFAFLAVMLSFNHLYFGEALPNTYHVKKESGFSLKYCAFIILVISPLLLLLLRQKYALFIALFGFCSFVAYKYSNSLLSMNYCERFSFHLFLPISMIIAFALSSKEVATEKIMLRLSRRFQSLLKLSPSLYVLCYGAFVSFVILNVSKLTHLANEYPRIINSHGELGHIMKSLAEGKKIQSASFGDAGLAPYNAEIPFLDNIGLGSAIVTHQGINSALETYSPDLCILYTRKTGEIVKSSNQEAILEYVNENDFMEVGKIYYYDGLYYTLYSKSDISSSFASLSEKTKAENTLPTFEYAMNYNLKNFPWHYWK